MDLLPIVNRKINSILSFMAGQNPEDRQKIEEMGFADKAETDKILKELEENKGEMLETLAALEAEEVRTRESLNNTILKGDMNSIVSNILMERIFKKQGDEETAAAFAEMQNPESVERLKEHLEIEEIKNMMDEKFEVRNQVLGETPMDDEEISELKEDALDLFKIA